jgi:hypothetical protein
MIRFALLFFCTVFAFADRLAFVGLPSVRIDGDGTQCVRVELSDQGSQKYQCRIVEKGKKFYWASRDNRVLIRAESGDFVYYISPEGTGFIKVALTKTEPYDYMESFTSELKTVTYWGKQSR